jgi:hypothetical protein
MRRLLILIACLFPAPILASQQTWLNSENPENGSYFSPRMKVSNMDDSIAFWPGASLGWIVGSVVTIGFEGYVLATDLAPEKAEGSSFNMAVAGMVFEAIPSPENRTHLAFNLLIGAGGSQVGGGFDVDSLAENAFFVLEPGAGVEFNLTRNIRICPGVRYLWISGNVHGMDSKWKISETAFNVSLKFTQPDP